MADPTSIVTALKDHEEDTARSSDLIKSAEALVKWGVGMLDTATGLVEHAGAAAGLAPVGQVISPSDGDNDHLTGNGTYEATTRGDIILKNISVTGVSARSDALRLIYMTDGQTFTLTPQNPGQPVGFVHKWRSAALADVELFSKKDAVMLSLMKPKRAIKELGIFGTNSLQGTIAATLWSETAYEHYKFISFHMQTLDWDNGVAAGDQNLNLDIGGVDTTGGVLNPVAADFTAAADQGAIKNAAVAITAANEVNAGDAVKVEMAASGTAFTSDVDAMFRLYSLIEYLPGA